MRIVISPDGNERVFAITNLSPTTTLAQILDMANADRRDWGERCWVDGVAYPADTECGDIPLVEGAVISNSAPPRRVGWTVAIAAGNHSGTCFPLDETRPCRVGRSPDADITIDSPSVSWSHCVLVIRDHHVWVTDDHSSNGTFVDGVRLDPDGGGREVHADTVIGVGGACLMVSNRAAEDAAPPHGYPGATHTLAFNRPPRPALPHHPRALTVPVKHETAKPTKFSWISVLVPLLMAVAMVAMMHSIRFGMIALLSPVMAVGSWWEQKHRSASSTVEAEEDYVAALQKFRTDIGEAATIERRRVSKETPFPHLSREVATTGAASLWQVRPSHVDYWRAHAGIADVPFAVPVEQRSQRCDERAQRVIDDAVIPACPVTVNFVDGAVGIWGNRAESLALARSLVTQVATRIGPADLRIGIFADKAQWEQWRWLAWLPHTQVGSSNPHDRWLGTDEQTTRSLLRQLHEHRGSMATPSFLAIIDSPALLAGRDNTLREILEWREDPAKAGHDRPISAIILAEHPDQLPAACHTVIHAKYDAALDVTIPSAHVTIPDAIGCLVDEPTATDWSRRLARFDDPETRESSAMLPSLVHLFDLLGVDRHVDAADIAALWREGDDYRTPLGVSYDGTYWFDLVHDGPHGLVGGTTGSGKSELLRSLIAGLAARVDAQHLTFVLVDFKGGAAFARLNELPHTIGTLSNLEASLAYRALRALEAEMLYRQQEFAEAGENVDSIDAYMATNPKTPMPRLLVVVDEFAQLAKEYPDVLSSLVSIGAVGRTLGVHMILATQRPEGALNDDILANTNMRTALRVQNAESSSAIISVPDAASIGRNQRGRAYIRLGEGDITPIQTALVTGVSDAADTTSVYADEVVLGTPPPDHMAAVATDAEADMDLLIEAISRAHEDAGYAQPRPVWPTPLGASVRLLLSDQAEADSTERAVTACAGETIVTALADDPGHQRQYATGWAPDQGNLLLVGVPGSGTTTALTSLALSLAATRDPATTDFLFLDMGTHGLEPLTALPHCRGYAGSGTANEEIQRRLLRYLAEELDRRTATPGAYPDLYVFVDGLATLRDQYDDADGLDLLELFYGVWGTGSAVGIHLVATTSRPKAIPTAISEVTVQKWLFRLAEDYDYSMFGVSRDNLPQAVPGRYVDVLSGHHAHVATPDDFNEAIREIADTGPRISRPPLIATLPAIVDVRELDHGAVIGPEKWTIPVGLSEATLGQVDLELWPGEHLLVAGPARSGKSTLVSAIATELRNAARQQGEALDVYVMAPPRSPLGHQGLGTTITPSKATHLLVPAQITDVPTLLVIDDAGQIGEADQGLRELIEANNANVHIIVAGRNDDFRGRYGDWTTLVRRSGAGVLLQPNVDYDGDLLGIRLDRRPPVTMTVGRGYACSNRTAELIQSISMTEAYDD